MTGTHHLSGPGAGLFGQIGRWLAVTAVTVAAAFMLFFSAAFALILLSGLAILAFVVVAFIWIRAKITGRPFGPRAQMEAHMADIRRQMEKTDMGFAHKTDDQGPIIDAHETPEGWTVER